MHPAFENLSLSVSYKHAFDYRKRFKKNIKTEALTGSMIKDPIRGITKKAAGAGPNSSVIAVIFAMALGVAPKPKPQTPEAITAAS